MPFCPNCGTEVQEGLNFCTSCGAHMPGGQNPVNNTYVDPDDHTAEFEPADIERNKYLAALCYLVFPVIFVALLAEPNSKFIRYHVNQAIMIDVLMIASCIVAIIPFLGWIACAVASVAAVVFYIMGTVRAFKGQAKNVPIVGKYTVIHWN